MFSNMVLCFSSVLTFVFVHLWGVKINKQHTGQCLLICFNYQKTLAFKEQHCMGIGPRRWGASTPELHF